MTEKSVTNGWFERYVTEKLDTISDTVLRLEKGDVSLQQRMSVVETRVRLGTAVWGILGGAVPGGVALLYILLA